MERVDCEGEVSVRQDLAPLASPLEDRKHRLTPRGDDILAEAFGENRVVL